MSIPYNLLRVVVDTSAICNNYKLLHAKAGNPVAVVKSDAYGHGLKAVSKALENAGCTHMAVGTVEEGAYLRQTGFTGRILALLGSQSARDDQTCLQHNILPFVGHSEQFKRIAEAAGKSRTAFEICLKFDTGMRRLGFSPAEAPAVAELALNTPNLAVRYVCSHLATADVPEEEAFVRKQERTFAAVCDALRPLGPFARCLANSAAILAYPELQLDAQRPGIAMYGANPFHGTDWQHLGEGLLPAMQAHAPVLQVRDLAPGDSVSYGRTFTAQRSMRIAVVAAGYADAYSRGLSSAGGNHAAMLLHGKRAPIVGRVCMQMTAVDVTAIPETAPGDRAFLLGGPGPETIRAEELATWWGTIPYEVMCLLGLNPREYD